MSKERDYVLGTHEEEVARLGLQHSVWRPTVLNCWQRAQITVGNKVLDVGAGPGYATADLAEIVGPTGEVVAVERSSKFVEAMRETCRARDLTNVKIHELDLMTDNLPGADFDFTWSRWVIAFVSDPGLLVKKIAGALKQNGVAIFHEYAAYTSWRFAPPRPGLAEFREHVIAEWRASGGEPDIGLELPALLAQNGLVVRSATPHVFCLRPNDYMWQWPSVFVDVQLERLREAGRVDDAFVKRVRAEMADATKDPRTLMLTPAVLEIIAEKV